MHYTLVISAIIVWCTFFTATTCSRVDEFVQYETTQRFYFAAQQQDTLYPVLPINDIKEIIPYAPKNLLLLLTSAALYSFDPVNSDLQRYDSMYKIVITPDTQVQLVNGEQLIVASSNLLYKCAMFHSCSNPQQVRVGNVTSMNNL